MAKRIALVTKQRKDRPGLKQMPHSSAHSNLKRPTLRIYLQEGTSLVGKKVELILELKEDWHLTSVDPDTPCRRHVKAKLKRPTQEKRPGLGSS